MKAEGSKQLIIPDTSIIIKWLVKEEEDVEHVEKMMKDFQEKKIEILVPSLYFWEVSNYLGRNFSPERAIEKCSYLQLLRFVEASMNMNVAHRAFQLMKSAPKVSFYDASYHALAIESGGTYITADERYYQQAKRYKKIQLLRDYGKRVK